MASPWKIRDREDDPRLEAARKRLRESVGQADTIEAIREIVTNLLGCEEIGLFAVGQRGNNKLLWSFGIDPQLYATLGPLFKEAILHRVLQGELHVAQPAHAGQGDQSVRALIPLRRDGQTVAVLLMLKLLPQKLGLDEADINLVKLLSNEAGRSLFEGSANANA